MQLASKFHLCRSLKEYFSRNFRNSYRFISKRFHHFENVLSSRVSRWGNTHVFSSETSLKLSTFNNDAGQIEWTSNTQHKLW